MFVNEKILQENGGPVDIMHYHIGTSTRMTCKWKVAEEYYRRIMKDPDSINFFTILREPREHLMSFYNYFISHRLGKVILYQYNFFGKTVFKSIT